MYFHLAGGGAYLSLMHISLYPCFISDRDFSGYPNSIQDILFNLEMQDLLEKGKPKYFNISNSFHLFSVKTRMTTSIKMNIKSSTVSELSKQNINI